MPKAAISLNIGRLKADVKQVQGNLKIAEQLILKATAKTMNLYMQDMVAAAQQNVSVRSGDLKASATVPEPVVTDKAIIQGGGFNIGYAAQRNFGGTIRATPGKALAIPLDPALTGNGVAKFSSPRELGGDARVIKLWGRAFIAKTAGKGKNRVLTLFYVLKDHVDQKGDAFFTSVVEDRRDKAPAAIASGVASALGGGQP